MISQEEIARINELARKAKSPEGLTPQDTAERHALRMAYLASVRENLTAQLEQISVVDEQGNKRKLEKKQP